MENNNVRLIAIEVDSPSDLALQRIQHRTQSTASVAFRKTIAITDYLAQALRDNRKILVEQEDGSFTQLVF